MTQRVRTRFAPSPTGFIHLGNIRSALYPWAFARRMKGDFILRIEDTDVERSTEEAVDVILESMAWLSGHRRRSVLPDAAHGPLSRGGTADARQRLAYHCYMSTEELDACAKRSVLPAKSRATTAWRPEPGKVLPEPPAGVQPVVRFKNPIGGSVWDDAVKGRIEISNDELDDLVIARPDGTPTYNFCVVVDDWT
jgi:glutamyl-tRNA synthetase